MVKFSKFVKFGDEDEKKKDGSFRQPVVVNGEYDIEIEEVGSKGDGIARIKGFVIFVPNTNKGEKCKIKIKEIRRKFAIGEKVTGKSTEKKVETPEEPKEKVEKSEEPKKEQEEPEKKAEKPKEKVEKKAGEKVEN